MASRYDLTIVRAQSVHIDARRFTCNSPLSASYSLPHPLPGGRLQGLNEAGE